MNKAELFEETRALLREPQVGTVQQPFTYDDADLIPQFRSAFRRLSVIGIVPIHQGAMDIDGTLTQEPSDLVGITACLYVAARLLKADLVQKLLNGEMGLVFTSGPDTIDTTTVARQFANKADAYDLEYQGMLTIALSVDTNTTGLAFGDGVAHGDAG